jgi:hypothetical protein
VDTFLCPRGHRSSEPDYCSECGAKIDAAAAASGGLIPGTAQVCPDCGTRHEDARVAFCEICGYNFVTGAHGEMPVQAPPAAAAPVPVTPAPVVAPVAATRWTVVVTVDASLREAGSPEAPAHLGPFTFEVNKPTMLIGRRSEARAIFPEIPLTFDEAVSHRHALLELSPEGVLMARDIGSSNGTRLNGKELPSMVDTPLQDGDELTVGHWTRLSVRAGA